MIVTTASRRPDLDISDLPTGQAEIIGHLNGPASNFQFLECEPASAVQNMAMDLALLEYAAVSRKAVLRLYSWIRPSVSFGRNEAVSKYWDTDAMISNGYDVVRRPTGGRALLHNREVTWSVTMPFAADLPWRSAYGEINQSLQKALTDIGIKANISESDSSGTVSMAGKTCFAAPSEGEIVVAESKIAGSSVWRTKHSYLQHGSILILNEQHELERFRREGAAFENSHSFSSPKALGEYLGAKSDADIKKMLTSALVTSFRVDTSDKGVSEWISSEQGQDCIRQSHDFISRPSWLWRS